MIRIELGERIKKLRKSKKITQSELARKIRLDRTFLSRVESGKQNITIDNLSLICKGLNVSLSYFFSSFKKTNSEEVVRDEI